MSHRIVTVIALVACTTALTSFSTINAKAASSVAAGARSQPAKSADKPKTAAGSVASTANSSPAKDGAYQGKAVLDPSQYYGLAAVGYASAKAAPEVMSKLFCYCGCDLTDNHNRLIDCFTSPHGVDCHICQEEAIMALKLHRQGAPMVEIQKQVDQEFAHHYPFTEETANYKKYKASRLWTRGEDEPKTAGADANVAHTEPAGPFPADKDAKNMPDASGSGTGANSDTPSASKSATAPKLKPGFHVGNCCGGEGKDKDSKEQK